MKTGCIAGQTLGECSVLTGSSVDWMCCLWPLAKSTLVLPGRTRRLPRAEALAVSAPRWENSDRGRQEEGEMGLERGWHREG